ncbi:hypothetical protein LXL04_036464 [Taraxacum kok-saghyz]
MKNDSRAMSEGVDDGAALSAKEAEDQTCAVAGNCRSSKADCRSSRATTQVEQVEDDDSGAGTADGMDASTEDSDFLQEGDAGEIAGMAVMNNQRTRAGGSEQSAGRSREERAELQRPPVKGKTPASAESSFHLGLDDLVKCYYVNKKHQNRTRKAANFAPAITKSEHIKIEQERLLKPKILPEYVAGEARRRKPTSSAGGVVDGDAVAGRRNRSSSSKKNPFQKYAYIQNNIATVNNKKRLKHNFGEIINWVTGYCTRYDPTYQILVNLYNQRESKVMLEIFYRLNEEVAYLCFSAPCTPFGTLPLGPHKTVRTESDIKGSYQTPRTPDRVRHQRQKNESAIFISEPSLSKNVGPSPWSAIKRTDSGPSPWSESESVIRRAIKQPLREYVD